MIVRIQYLHQGFKKIPSKHNYSLPTNSWPGLKGMIRNTWEVWSRSGLTIYAKDNEQDGIKKGATRSKKAAR